MIDFNQMITNHIKREWRPKGIGKYYPSEAGLCIRKSWFSYKYPQEVDPELLKIFEMGNMIHDFVVNVLKSEKNPEVELLKTEMPFKAQMDGFEISGRIDDLILIKLSGQNVLVEVKSSSDIDYVKGPSPHNEMQLQLYMHFTGVHNGVLLYVGKKDLKSKVFPIAYDEQKALEILERFKKLHVCLTKDVIPDPEARESKDKTWMCKYCEYSERCYQETPRSGKWM
jgi:CRISPR/Cas system-associated exonuclease Cas4 (RecB family)